MKKNSTKGKQRSIVRYEMLEECIRMKAHWLLPDVLEGKQFINGVAIEENKSAERKAA